MKVATEPGIFVGLSFDEYVQLNAVNSHILSQLASATPAHLRYQLLHGGQDPTPALDLGWLVHLALLEPERFAGEVVVAPKVDRRTTTGKTMWAQFEAANPGRLHIDPEEYARAAGMRDAVLANPTAAGFFQGRGRSEVSIVWEDAATGVLCKARIDRVGFVAEWPVVGDLKTARAADRRSFEQAAYRYGYHIQAAHYLAGLQALVPIPEGNPYRRFVFFVVESSPPYCTAYYEFDEAAMAQAETERQRHLRTWCRCQDSGVWPGYPDSIALASLPAWAYRASSELGD